MQFHGMYKTTSSDPLLLYHLRLLLPSKPTELWFGQSSENCEPQCKKCPCGEIRTVKLDCKKQKPAKDEFKNARITLYDFILRKQFIYHSLLLTTSTEGSSAF